MFIRKYILLFFLMGSLSAQAGEGGYAQATPAETNVYLGQVFNVDVVVKATRPAVEPELDGLQDFNAVLIEAGALRNATNLWLYRYAFRARRAGLLTIPPMRFGQVETEPLSIHAEKPVATDRMSLTGRLSERSVYIGEPVLLSMEWDSTYPFSVLKAVDFHFPLMDDTRFDMVEPFDPDSEMKDDATGLPVHGTRVLADRRSYEKDGAQHQSLSFSKILVPRRSGVLAIPPSTLLCAADEGAADNAKLNRRNAFQYPAYFDNVFFDQNVTDRDYARIYTESKPLTLEVKPLPVDGRPSGFNGLVGEFSMTVEAEPNQVRVGEAVTLRIIITTPGMMESIDFPPLREQPTLTVNFEVPSERALPERTKSSKIYTQTIRPLVTSVSNVPPLELSFFNPSSNAYVTVRSEPIPLTVEASTGVAIYSGEDGPVILQPEDQQSDEDQPAMPSVDWTAFSNKTKTVLIWTAIVLLSMVAGVWLSNRFLGRVLHHARSRSMAPRAGRIFQKRMMHLTHSSRTKCELYCELDRLLRDYLGNRLQLNSGALTFREVESRLSTCGMETGVVDELRDFFMRCEAYRFTRGFDGEADAESVVRHAIRIVEIVENGLKQSGRR